MRFKIPAKQPAAFKASALYLAGRSRGQSPNRVAWMEVRNLETKDPVVAAAIMEATASRNLRCKKPTYHFVLSFDPKDAKLGKVPPEVMRDIANEAIERLGLTKHQMMIYAHKDTKHPHMHFLVNRIHPQTGKAFDRHNDGRKLTALCRDIARERGLNIPLDRARIREKERVDDFDELAKLKKDPPPTPKIREGEYWQAKRDEREPQEAMDKEAVKALRKKVQSHFYNAKDWHDLAARLGAQGVFLHRKGQGIVLSKGDHFAKLSQMGKGVRLKELEERFGERFDTFAARRVKALMKEEAPEAKIPDYETMTPAERGRARRKYEAQLAVERNRDDPVMELDAADLEYHYWKGVDEMYRFHERRIRRLEQKRAWMDTQLERRKGYARKSRGRLQDSLATIYGNAKRAEKRWLALEKKYGIEEAAKMVKETPVRLGLIKGFDLGIETKARKDAKKALRYLLEKRSRFRRQQQELEAHRGKMLENKRLLKIALRDFELLKGRANVPYELRAILRDRIQRRAKAMKRVTYEMITESSLATDRKNELFIAHRRFKYRQMQLDKEREFFGRGW